MLKEFNFYNKKNTAERLLADQVFVTCKCATHVSSGACNYTLILI